MKSTKILLAICVLFLCAACNKGFEAKEGVHAIGSNNQIAEDNTAPSGSATLDEAFRNRNNLSSGFDIKIITNATWKMVGYFEQKTVPVYPDSSTGGAQTNFTKTPVNGISLGISVSQTIQNVKNDCLGGPCPAVAMEQSMLALTSSCYTASVRANFEPTIMYGPQSQTVINGIKLAGQASVNSQCGGNLDPALTALIDILPSATSSAGPTTIGIWGPYLYIGVGGLKTFVFMK